MEAHLFIAFLTYCLHVTLGQRTQITRPRADCAPRSGEVCRRQMVDVHIPTTDQRELWLTRYTQPEPDLRLLVDRLKLTLPAQPPPKITTAQAAAANSL